jgi:glycosyltransferase involved in cell wall biosynthesis
MNLSVVIIAFNEESKIAGAIGSALFADEVLVLDSGSTDRTVAVARSLGARVVHQPWLGFGKQKQRAVDLARNDWVFVLDSDERITSELRDEIRRKIARAGHSGYRVARLNHFFGRPIRHCGLYPDYSIRLFDKRVGRFTDDEVHERVVLRGPVGKLKCPMIHLAYESVDQFIAKMNQYSSLRRDNNLARALFNPVWRFIKMYFLNLGFLDGKQGLTIALLYSQYTFWKYIK